MKKTLLLCLLTTHLFWSCSGNDGPDEPVPTIVAPTEIQVFDINNRNDASDIRVFFFFRGPVENVKQVRIMVIPEGKRDEVTLDHFLNDDNRALVISSRSGENRGNMVASINDFEGNPVRNGQPYVIGVAAIHNLDVSASTFTISTESVTLADIPLRDLYVSNSRNSSIIIIDEVTGEVVKNFVDPFSGGLNETQELIELENGNFMVTGFGNTALKLYSGETGDFLENFTKGYFLTAPSKTAIGPDGLIYVSQWFDGNNHVARFNASSGAFIDEYILDVAQGMGHAWDSNQNYYLASFGLGAVTKYDAQGNEIGTIGEDILDAPVNVWVDEERNGLFVVDWYAGVVRKFNLATGESEGNLVEGLQRVEGFMFGRNNALYLCDWLNNSVNEYDLTTGELRRILQTDVLLNPNSISYGPNVDPN